jgi:hypothetical protein
VNSTSASVRGNYSKRDLVVAKLIITARNTLLRLPTKMSDSQQITLETAALLDTEIRAALFELSECRFTTGENGKWQHTVKKQKS